MRTALQPGVAVGLFFCRYPHTGTCGHG